MKKSDLVQVARKELGMSFAETKAKTVPILKEKIAINRGLRRWTLCRFIDYMKKSDLAVVARKELGMSLAQANALESETLKSAIRTALKSVIRTPPRNLDHRKLTELRDEVHTRGLPVIPNATRVQMKRQIQEDADARARTWLSTAATNAEARWTVDGGRVDEHGGRGLRESGGRVDAGVLGGNVEIDAVGERESDAINQNLENKKEEDMTDD